MKRNWKRKAQEYGDTAVVKRLEYRQCAQPAILR
jgi:hypothetical protein